MTVLESLLGRSRTILSLLAMIFLVGFFTYVHMPKEADPDIQIPVIVVNVSLPGASPDDSERLLIRPMEQKFLGLNNVKQIKSTSFEGGGYVTVEFNPGFDATKAFTDVKMKVDEAKPLLPREAKEPTVSEINLSELPVLVVNLSGPLPDRTLYKIAQDLKDDIEASIPSVLKTALQGNRRDRVELQVDPNRLEAYNLSVETIIQFFTRSNTLVSAGALEGQLGRFPVKVPSLISNEAAIGDLPLKQVDGATVRFKDLVTVKRTFEDPQTIARINGKKSVSLEISKRSGEHLIGMVGDVRDLIAKKQKEWPSTLEVHYTRDKSDNIHEMLADLENSVITAILLVMAVITLSLGKRPALLVGIAVPGSFLMGILALKAMGLTINIVVLFSLILSVGMLVDGAIIVVEYAQRRTQEGATRQAAYIEAAHRMFWPVLTSTLTIIVVFAPLLFWPGIIGKFMQYLPITLIATLGASILMAIIFVPTLGILWKGIETSPHGGQEEDQSIYSRFVAKYLSFLNHALDHPKRVLGGAGALLVAVLGSYGVLGNGAEFFPKVEPDFANIEISTLGNLSIQEKDKVLKEVEEKVLQDPSIKTAYSVVYGILTDANAREDLIGTITLEFVNWQKRPKADVILEGYRQTLASIPGIKINIAEDRAGPQGGPPIQLLISGKTPQQTLAAVNKVKEYLLAHKGLKNIQDNRSLPGTEIQLVVNQEEAYKFGLDVTTIGETIKLVTVGSKLGTYRPDDVKEEVDIVVRFPEEFRTIDRLQTLKVNTNKGAVPMMNFTNLEFKPKVGLLRRVDGQRVVTLEADVQPDVSAFDVTQELQNWLEKNPLPKGVEYKFKGEAEDTEETSTFLQSAFLIAIGLILIILVTQFNSFFSSFLVLSAVLLSTVGVALGLIITQQPFGIVMGGIGVIALAGIIVSNNIILIDTYDILKKTLPPREAIVKTCEQRIRPVILTKTTTILGLLPIAFGINIDYFGLQITQGAPATQWWLQLSQTIIFGVLFASVLTLFVTPSALMWQANRRKVV